MITTTLLDITAITVLKPSGKVFNYMDIAPVPLKFDVGKACKPTYNNFIEHHAKTYGPITD